MLPINALNILVAEEEERLEDIRRENIERRLMRDASNCFAINDTRFKELFRLTKDMAQYIFNGISPQIHQRDNPVSAPPQIKFFGALHFYATGTYQRVIGQSYNISLSQQSMSRAIVEVTAAIINVFSEQWIQFPHTLVIKNQIKENFMEKTQFPGVIGAIDCTHIRIIRPSVQEHNYLNRKGYHSKNVQIICDYNLKILNVNAQYAGATHDSYIWRNSMVRTELEACYNRGDRNSWLVGDSVYPQEPWLMTPIQNAQPDTPEYRYTQTHIQTRNCVERCIGILKGRFLCLSKILRYSPEKVGNVVNVCAILHNICVEGRLNMGFDIPFPEEMHQNIDVNRIENRPPLNHEGINVRRNIVQRYFA